MSFNYKSATFERESIENLQASQKEEIMKKLRDEIDSIKAKYTLTTKQPKSNSPEKLEKPFNNSSSSSFNYKTMNVNNSNLEQKFQKIIDHDQDFNYKNEKMNKNLENPNSDAEVEDEKPVRNVHNSQNEEDLDVEKDNLSDFDMNEYSHEEEHVQKKPEKVLKNNSANIVHSLEFENNKTSNEYLNRQSFDPKYCNFNQENLNVKINNKNSKMNEFNEQIENDKINNMNKYLHNDFLKSSHNNDSDYQKNQTNLKRYDNYNNEEEEMEECNRNRDQNIERERQDKFNRYSQNEENENYNSNKGVHNMKNQYDMDAIEIGIDEMGDEEYYENPQIEEIDYRNYGNVNQEVQELKEVKSQTQKGDYSIFDKAKNDLLKVKQQIDEMDQYDYKNYNPNNIQGDQNSRQNEQCGNIYQNNNPNINSYEVNQASDEEEIPKNFEKEYSIRSGRGKVDQNFQNSEKFNTSSKKPYNFTNPLVDGLKTGNMERTNTNPNKSKEIFKSNEYISNLFNNVNNIQTHNRQSRQSRSREKMNQNNSNKFEKNKYSSKAIEMKREKQREYSSEEKTMTPYFKKMINKYNPKYRNDKSKDKFNRLKSELEEKMREECSFQPNINKTSINVISSKMDSESKDDLFKRLSTPKALEVQKRLKEKENQEQEKTNQVCTFKPKITNTIPLNNDPAEKVQNRLFRLAEQLKEKREKLKRENQENLAKEHSFTPVIDENSKQLTMKYGNRPLHERYEEIVQNKRENLQRLRTCTEKEMSKYRPEINPKSIEIVNRKNINTNESFTGIIDVGERLYREGIKNKKKETEGYDNQLDNCTFTPQLYYSSIQPGGNIDDFLERQQFYEEIKRERQERKLSKSIDKIECSFTPQINLTSDILMKADYSRANESHNDRINRLYKINFETQQNRKEQLEKFYYAQYDFKPKINEISKCVGRSSSIKDLVVKKESAKIKNYRDQKLQKEEERCSFKPVTNKEKYTNIKSNYKNDGDIFKRIQDEVKSKHEKIDEKKTNLEEKNLKDCNFKPELNTNMPNFDFKEPIMLKGFAKHIEHMEKAKKAKREKEERIKEVFTTGENWSRDNIITIPKPFKLSYQNVDKTEKKEQLEKKTKGVEMKECTFQPKTNESKNKEIIKMILKD